MLLNAGENDEEEDDDDDETGPDNTISRIMALLSMSCLP